MSERSIGLRRGCCVGSAADSDRGAEEVGGGRGLPTWWGLFGKGGGGEGRGAADEEMSRLTGAAYREGCV